MVTRLMLPIAAFAGFVFAGYGIREGMRPVPVAPLYSQPPEGPRTIRAVAGAGLVEARQENIPVGTTIAGVVTKVFVKKGDEVHAGDPLFQIDDRDVKSRLAVQEANLASMKAQFARLEAAPNSTMDIPTAEAAVEEARAKLEDTEAKYRRSEKLYQRQMIAAGDFDVDRFAYSASKATLMKAEAELDRIKKTWDADKQVARVAVLMAESQVLDARTNLERLTVRALADGVILQLHVRLGQFAALQWNEPLIVLGDVKRLHVRVDIDENDLPYFDPNAEAVATLKGRPGVKFKLERVYVEPYVIPKQSLTGSNSERVDTRVLQVIYRLPDKRPIELHVGQQMDVYMRAATIPKDLMLDADAAQRPFDDDATKHAAGMSAPDKSKNR